MVATAESVHEQGLPGGVDVVAVERDGAAEAAGGMRRKRAQTGPKGSTSEGAAGAYGMYGAAARTNFEQNPTAAAAKTDFEQEPTAAAADDGDVSSVDLPSDFPKLPACDVRSDSIIPGPALDVLRIDADLTPAERQQVDEFLIDMGFADVVD